MGITILETGFNKGSIFVSWDSILSIAAYKIESVKLLHYLDIGFENGEFIEHLVDDHDSDPLVSALSKQFDININAKLKELNDKPLTLWQR